MPSFIDRKVDEREVIIELETGQEKIMGDYQPTPKELEFGAWSHQTRWFYSNGEPILTLGDDDLRSCYYLDWNTSLTTEEVLRVFRKNISDMRIRFADPLANSKLFNESRGQVLVSSSGVRNEFPLDFFLDEKRFRKHLEKVGAVFLRVDTGYGTFCYTAPDTPDRKPNITYGSGMGIADFVPRMIRETNTSHLTEGIYEAIRITLEKVIEKYPPYRPRT